MTEPQPKVPPADRVSKMEETRKRWEAQTPEQKAAARVRYQEFLNRTPPAEIEAQRKAKMDEVEARVAAAPPGYKAALIRQHQEFLNRTVTLKPDSSSGETV